MKVFRKELFLQDAINLALNCDIMLSGNPCQIINSKNGWFDYLDGKDVSGREWCEAAFRDWCEVI